MRELVFLMERQDRSDSLHGGDEGETPPLHSALFSYCST